MDSSKSASETSEDAFFFAFFFACIYLLFSQEYVFTYNILVSNQTLNRNYLL